jgi:hypothetical protein
VIEESYADGPLAGARLEAYRVLSGRDGSPLLVPVPMAVTPY